MDKKAIRNRIGCLFVKPLEPGVHDTTGEDNLAIALATYFESHTDRPADDPQHPEHEAWGKWAIERTDALLDRIVEELVKP